MLIRRVIGLVIAVAVLAALVALGSGCSGSEQSASPAPSEGTGTEAPAPPAAGLRLAPGLYDLEDGTAQATGSLEWSELEGGFWVITEAPVDAAGVPGKTVAVIANGSEYQAELEPLKGKQVLVTGKRLEGASIRMAGPEIEIDSVEELSDTPGISE